MPKPSKKQLTTNDTLFLTTKAAAKHFDYAADYVLRLAREGTVEARKVRGSWQVSLQSLETYVASVEAANAKRAEELSEIPNAKKEIVTTELDDSSVPETSTVVDSEVVTKKSDQKSALMPAISFVVIVLMFVTTTTSSARMLSTDQSLIDTVKIDTVKTFSFAGGNLFDRNNVNGDLMAAVGNGDGFISKMAKKFFCSLNDVFGGGCVSDGDNSTLPYASLPTTDTVQSDDYISDLVVVLDPQPNIINQPVATPNVPERKISVVNSPASVQSTVVNNYTTPRLTDNYVTDREVLALYMLARNQEDAVTHDDLAKLGKKIRRQSSGDNDRSSDNDKNVRNDILDGSTFNGRVAFEGLPEGAGINQGTLYINPATANPTDVLFGLAVNGQEKLSINATGDISGNNLTLSGDIESRNITPATDSTYAIGTNLLRYANLFTDTLTSGTATLTGGSLTDSSGAISFGDENLSTTGLMSIGTATPQAGNVLTVLGNTYLNGDLTVTGDSLTLGSSTSDNLIVNSQVASDLIPDQNAVYDLGSPSFFWDDGYFDRIVVNNISATQTSIGGTSESQFIINSDNSSADLEESSLVFYRGTVVPNAILRWNNTDDQFEMNQDLVVEDETPANGSTRFIVKAGEGQSGNLVQVQNNAGTNLFTVSDAGAINTTSTLNADGATTLGSTLGVTGATTLQSTLGVTGATTLNSTLGVTGNTSLSTLSTSGLSTLDSLSVTNNTIVGGTLGVTGATTLSSTLGVTGATTLSSTLGVTGATTLSSTANVTGLLTASSGINVNSETITDFTGTGLSISGGALTVDHSSVDAEDFSTSLSAGSIVFSNGSNFTEDNANLFWDDANDNLGIGVTTPTEKLRVGADASNTNIRVSNYTYLGQTSGGYSTILGNNAKAVSNALQVAESSAINGARAIEMIYDSGIKFFADSGSVTAGDSLIERMRITNDGKVGIGTTSPGNKLVVDGSTVADRSVAIIVNDSGAAGGLVIQDTSGNKVADLYDGGSITETGILDLYDEGSIQIKLSADVGSNSYLNAGNVGIGNTAPAQKLHVTGTIRQTAATLCSLEASLNGDIQCVTSDQQFKTKSGDVNNALDIIGNLNPIYYTWDDTERFGDRRDIGFFAQNVRDHLPEAITDTGEYLSLNYGRLTALNMAGIKELQSIDTEITVTVDSLDQRLTALEEKVAAIPSYRVPGDSTGSKSTIAKILEKMDVMTTSVGSMFNKLFVRELVVVKPETGNAMSSPVGQATIKSGDKEVVIENDLVKSTSQVMITPRGPVSDWYLSEVIDGQFTISVKSAVTKDTKFDYWIIGIVEANTNSTNTDSTSGDSTESQETINGMPVMKPIDYNEPEPAPEPTPNDTTDPEPAPEPANDSTTGTDTDSESTDPTPEPVGSNQSNEGTGAATESTANNSESTSEVS